MTARSPGTSGHPRGHALVLVLEMLPDGPAFKGNGVCHESDESLDNYGGERRTEAMVTASRSSWPLQYRQLPFLESLPFILMYLISSLWDSDLLILPAARNCAYLFVSLAHPCGQTTMLRCRITASISL
jgi:hypothetical protein